MNNSNEIITIKDIARICGVGVSTVSRAINDHQDINPETKTLILDTIKKYGYVPNNSARNLKRVDATTIAILVKGIANPFFTSMIRVIEDEAQKRKYSVELRHVEYGEDEVDIALELIKEKRLRGIIFLGGYFSHSEDKLSILNIPFVLVSAGCIPETLNKEIYSSYTVDDEEEGYKVTKYLIDQGHRDIAILSGERDSMSVGQLRANGYKRALEEAGIDVREELILTMKDEIEYYSFANGYENMRSLLKKGTKITAVFAISDVLAIGACRAIKEAGLRVPEDISVVGFDGIDLGRYSNPSLTTLKQPAEEIADASSVLLFDLIEGRKQNQHRVFGGELVLRESVCARK